MTTLLLSYARVVPYPSSVTHLTSTTLRRSVGIEGCATDFPRLSKHEHAFTVLCSCQLPYLSQGWAQIYRSHSHSTPRGSTSIKLLPCTLSQPKLQSFDQSTFCVACRLPVKPIQRIEPSLESRYGIYNGRAESTLPLICRCLHRVRRVHHRRRHFPLDPVFVVLPISLTPPTSAFFAVSRLANTSGHINTWLELSSGLCCRYSLVRTSTWLLLSQ